MSVTSYNIKAKSHILTLLGNELIGSDSLAIFELVKNSYDADAENVTITFMDLNSHSQKIIIEDDGYGMSKDTLQNVWLTIGTDFKRGTNRKESHKFSRLSFGNKGVGRLAVHKLAKSITLESRTADDLFSSRLTIDWKKLINSKEYIQDLQVEIEDVADVYFEKGHGTRIILTDLTTNNWTKKGLKDLVRRIENIKNPFSDFPDFNVEVKCNDFHQDWLHDIKSPIEILSDSLYQFEFEIDKWSENSLINNLAEFRWSYNFNPPTQTNIAKRKVEKKLKSDNITNENYFQIGDLFQEIDGKETSNKYLRNGDLINIGKITGKFFIFNQNSLLLNMRFAGQINAVKSYIKENSGVKIFRDKIRVYNYGEPSDDWLGLDLDKIQRTGDHFGKKVTVGFVELSLKESIDGLIEKTNREGFIDNYEFTKFSLLVKEVYNFFEREAADDKDFIEEFIESTKPIKKVGFGDTLRDLAKKANESAISKELSPLIKRLDKDYTEMRDIMVNSGLTGLNLGVAFHEVEREMHFINADLNSTTINIENIKNRVGNLLQILESLSPILKQNKNIASTAKYIVERAKHVNINRFSYHKVIFSSPLLSGENSDFKFKGPTNLLISAISNLIDNAIYWTTDKRDLIGENFQPAIYIGTDLNTFEKPAIIIADNGNGFVIDPELLTQPFKTKKEGGMGLGLYFADLVMNMIGGKLIFPDSSDLDIPKVYNGACIALIFENSSLYV
jgi:signal transduction histidine kinase